MNDENKTQPATSLEDMIRRIVREELQAMMRNMTEDCNNTRNYLLQDEAHDEWKMFGAIENVVEHQAEFLPHAWDCEIRNEDVDSNCNCGVGDSPS